MTAARVSTLAAVLSALALFAVASVLNFEPDRPIANRTDVFFQSDAGGIVRDAVTNFKERSRGTHPAVYPLWTLPLHKLAAALSPTVPMGTTATYGSRVLVNTVAGIGIGVLVFGLLRFGVSRWHLAAIAPVLWFGNGNTIAAIPDHFGLSLGIFGASFGVYLLDGRVRFRLVALLLLSGLAFAITVTNFVVPAGLLALVIVTNYRIKWWLYAAVVGLGLIAVAALAVFIQSRPDIRQRIDERIGLYLTWKLTAEPEMAAKLVARGIMDSAVAPTPVVSSTSNLDRTPMLTYQPAGEPYRVWPYNYVQSVGVACWLAVLLGGLTMALRQARMRQPVLFLLLWVGWNGVLHTVWGDEFFLYTPHYAWALVTVAVLGWSTRPARWLVVPCAAIVVAAVSTLLQYRELMQTFAV